MATLDVLLTLFIPVGIAIVMLSAGMVARLNNVFKGASTLALYVAVYLGLAPVRMLDPTPLGLTDLFAGILVAYWGFIHVGRDRDWFKGLNERFPAADMLFHIGGTALFGISFRVVADVPFNPVRDSFTLVLLFGLIGHLIMDGWSKVKDKKLKEEWDKIRP